MRKDDQRIGSGLGRSITHGHLTPMGVGQRNGEGVLGSWRNILASMLRSCRIPDLTREQAVPHRIKSLDGTHTNRKSPPDEWIVLGRPVRRPFFGILFRMLNILVSHKEYPAQFCTCFITTL